MSYYGNTKNEYDDFDDDFDSESDDDFEDY
jgi:hypothetical protein